MCQLNDFTIAQSAFTNAIALLANLATWMVHTAISVLKNLTTECVTSHFHSLIFYYLSRSSPVYLVEFTTYQAPERCKVTHERFMYCTSAATEFSKESLEFQERLLYRTGLGEETYFPSRK